MSIFSTKDAIAWSIENTSDFPHADLPNGCILSWIFEQLTELNFIGKGSDFNTFIVLWGIKPDTIIPITWKQDKQTLRYFLEQIGLFGVLVNVYAELVFGVNQLPNKDNARLRALKDRGILDKLDKLIQTYKGNQINDYLRICRGIEVFCNKYQNGMPYLDRDFVIKELRKLTKEGV